MFQFVRQKLSFSVSLVFKNFKLIKPSNCFPSLLFSLKEYYINGNKITLKLSFLFAWQNTLGIHLGCFQFNNLLLLKKSPWCGCTAICSPFKDTSGSQVEPLWIKLWRAFPWMRVSPKMIIFQATFSGVQLLCLNMVCSALWILTKLLCHLHSHQWHKHVFS